MKNTMLKKIKIFLNKDIKEFNIIVLSVLCILFIMVSGIISYKISHSYALFSDEINGKKTLEISVDTCKKYPPNKPVLSENMIAVYYDTESNVWKKADSTNENENYKWYDYCEKIWANSVTVTEEKRQNYINANSGTEIPMEDILTMQVWIPRYKYVVWNYNENGKKESGPQEIQIKFETSKLTTGEIECTDNIQGSSTGTKEGAPATSSEICKLKVNNENCTDNICNGKTYTHPAFTFGEEELEGIWIGKFELGTIKSDICNTNPTIVNCNIEEKNFTTIPNTKAYVDATLSVFDYNVRAMNNSNNIYGFSSNDDTHIIKNMEWGAVAYLSHSRYGLCTNGECHEIGINRNNTRTTGCGPQNLTDDSNSNLCNTYETELGQYSSTTGNIYGIYDMGGGIYEISMAQIVSPNGIDLMSGISSTESQKHTGYTGISYNEGNYDIYQGNYSFPENKYIDKYSFGTIRTDRQKAKLGDATKELNWYDDSNYIITTENPSIFRGGTSTSGATPGLFYSTPGVFHIGASIGTRMSISIG